MLNATKIPAINTSVYPLEAIYSACYSLMDRAYFYLEEDSKGRVLVHIKAKQPAGPKKSGELADDFLDELLHHALRHKIVQSNQKIREQIITQALVSAQPAGSGMSDQLHAPKKPAQAPLDKDLEAEIEKLLAEVEKDGGTDPLQVAVPWEKKYSSRKGVGKKGRGKVR